jgi:hypothetical protein
MIFPKTQDVNCVRIPHIYFTKADAYGQRTPTPTPSNFLVCTRVGFIIFLPT